MPESKQERAESKKSTEQLKAERQSDATDDEALRAEETGSGTSRSKPESDRSPSPDGQFDEKREGDDAGPM